MKPPAPPSHHAADRTAPAGDGFADTASRPASLWPDTTRQGDAAGSASASSQFATTRFDPLAEERTRMRAQAAAAFDVCHPALALRAVLLVQGVLAIAALAGADSAAGWGRVQAALAFVGVGGTLLWLVAVCGLRGALRDRSAGARSAVVLALGAAAAVTGWLPLWWAGLGGDAHALRIAGLALAGAAFAGLLWAWLDLRARIWHPADASARLAELQSRIRPHFLFNALNTALALVRTDPAKAEAVLEDLAQLFRTALAETGASVPLDEEIELAKRYLDIEHARYGDRLRVHWEVDPRCGAARVPPLVLQPLVENAVRHGVEPAAAGGDVWVRVLRQRAQVLVTVSNTLGDEPGTPGHGMALHSVRERLRLLHDVGAQCDVWRDVSRDGTPPSAMFHARITLPAP